MRRSDIRLEPEVKKEPVNTIDDVNSKVLKGLSMAGLRRLWRKRVGKKDPPRIRSLILRELAWHEQQAVQGGLDAQTRALLRSAITQAKSTPARPGPRPRNTSRIPSRAKPDLQPGTKLIRTWRGRQYEVIVRDKNNAEGGGRFEYNGETFRGLTAIAEKITGAHWSGPRFFGLNKAGASR